MYCVHIMFAVYLDVILRSQKSTRNYSCTSVQRTLHLGSWNSVWQTNETIHPHQVERQAYASASQTGKCSNRICWNSIPIWFIIILLTHISMVLITIRCVRDTYAYALCSANYNRSKYFVWNLHIQRNLKAINNYSYRTTRY